MNVKRFLLILLGVWVFASGAFSQSPPYLKIDVDPSIRFQTMDHFGVSAAWWAQEVGTWPAETRDRILDLLFDPVKGIGLSVVRYNIGAGKENSGIADPWRSAASPLDDKGEVDWNRDLPAVSIVDGAVARGAGVILFVNSPPASMTLTGKPTGNGRLNNLSPDGVSNFARFLANCVESLENRWPLLAISPINEPQWDWAPSKGQEGSAYSPEDADRVIRAVASEFDRRAIRLPISAVDSASWSISQNTSYLKLLADDPDVRAYLTPYAVHSYWSGFQDKKDLAALMESQWPGLGLWQTEWTEMRTGKAPGMDAALTLATTVSEDISVGQARSWQYWIAASKYDYADGLLYVDVDSQSFQTTKKLWAMGNWSRFVRPGAHRIAASVASSTGVELTAFRNLDESTVLVLVNASQNEEGPFAVRLPGETRDAERWETSDSRDLEDLGTVPLDSLTLPPKSVTTLVLEGD